LNLKIKMSKNERRFVYSAIIFIFAFVILMAVFWFNHNIPIIGSSLFAAFAGIGIGQTVIWITEKTGLLMKAKRGA